MCKIKTIVVVVLFVFISSGLYYYVIGCSSLLCVFYKKEDGVLNKFVSNSTNTLNGVFLTPTQQCVIVLDNNYKKKTIVNSYNNYMINNTYELMIKNVDKSCFFDKENKLKNYSFNGFLILCFGGTMQIITVYFYYIYDSKLKIQSNDNYKNIDVVICQSI